MQLPSLEWVNQDSAYLRQLRGGFTWLRFADELELAARNIRDRHLTLRIEFAQSGEPGELAALLTGMNGQQALAFTALNLPFGLAILLGIAMLAPLPVHWRLPGITLLLAGCALATLQLGGDWLNPLAIWSLHALLGLEILWQSRPRARIGARTRS